MVFNKVKNSYFEIGYYIVCNNYGVNVDEIWMNGDWFHTPAYGFFGDGKRSFSGKLAEWIITQSKIFTKKGIKKDK